MILPVYLLMFLLSATSSYRKRSYRNDYCYIKSCPKPSDHTLCLYESEYDLGCKEDNVKLGPYESEHRQFLLRLHNQLRARIASGKTPAGQPGGALPTARNLEKLRWNTEAEVIARRWAAQCVKKHDKCRNLQDGTSSGQNYAQCNLNLDTSGGSTLEANRSQALEDCFRVWSDQYKDVKPETIKKLGGFFSGRNTTGDFTQIISSSVTSVGCAFLEMGIRDEHHQEVILFCNYVPAGNRVNEAVYKSGKPCSKCSRKSKCSRSFPGLCTSDLYDKGTGFHFSSSCAIVFICLFIICATGRHFGNCI